MAYFKCKGDSKPKKLLVADWDFSSNSPLVDKVNGYVLTNNNVTFEPYDGGNVANFAKWSSYLLLPEQLVFTPNSGYDSFEYVIDFKKENGNNTWLFGYYDDWPYRTPNMAININRFSSGKVTWNFCSRAITDNPDDVSTLDESILTVVLSKDDGAILPKLFKNGNDITHPQVTSYTDFTYTNGKVALGTTEGALLMYVGGLKVYANKN